MKVIIRHKLAVGVLSVAVYATTAYAEMETKPQDPDADLFSLSLEDLLSVEISGATLTSESIYTTPSSVTVFSRDEIKRMGVNALYELMNLAPGFQVLRTPGNSTYGAASVRSRRIGNASAEILILVDGQRMGTQRTGGIIDFLEMPVSGIERVEFIRGPGAALYGSNAMMGVVNIVTVSRVREIKVGTGNLGQTVANVLYGGKLGEAVLDARFDYSESSGEEFTLQDSFSDSLLKTTDPKQKVDVNVKGRLNKTEILLSYAENSMENFYVAELLAPDYNEFSVKNYSVALSQGFGGERFSSKAWLSYASVTETLLPQVFGAGLLQSISTPSGSEPLLLDMKFVGDEVRAMLHNNWQISDTAQFLFGAEWRRVSIREGLAYANYDLEGIVKRDYPIAFYGEQFQPTTIQLESDEDIIGIYGQYLAQPWKNTRLTLGLRYDNYSELSDSQLSPRLALVQTLTNHHTIKVLYGDAYRAPTPSETGLINNPATLGNPDLKAETVHSWDFIWLASFANVSWTLGYFENRFENSILQVLSSNSSIVKEYNNASQDPIKGMEFEVNYQLSAEWMIRGNYTYISESPEITFRESKDLGSVTLNYQNGKWNANLAVAYRGKRFGPDPSDFTGKKEFDGYWLSYAKVQYAVNDSWQVYMRGSNLNNERYSFPAQGTGVPNGIPARGREFLLGIKWSY